MPVNGKSNGRFELPQLTPVNFSLTDGTGIPPPPDSPIEEKPPPVAAKSASDEAATVVANGNNANANGDVRDGRGRTDGTDIPPISPASTTRPSSIRRFLSRKSLNANYTNGTNHNGSHEDLTGVGRPDSPSSFMTNSRPSLKQKKSGSWFKRMTSSGSGKRSSIVYEEKPVVQNMGPPPPKLPELNQLKAKVPENDDGSLGADDMFKNIK